MRFPLFACPAYDVNIGNMSESLFFILLKAMRQGRKASLVRKKIFLPKSVQQRFRLRQLTALFELCSPHIEAQKGLANEALATLMGLSFVSHFGLQAAKRLLRLTPGFSFSTPSLGIDDIYNLGLAKSFDERLVLGSYWEDMLQYDFGVEVPEQSKPACARSLEALGLEAGRYVCLHIRTPHYHADPETNVYRNASPDAYNEAIDYIISQGLKVVRLGDAVPGVFAPRDGYIDYPLSPQRTEMMDLYLIKNCRYYIGMVSGPIDVAYLMHKPVLSVNASDYMFSRPYKQIDRYIYKHIHSRKLNRVLTFKELLEGDASVESHGNDQFLQRFVEHYVQVDNSSQDILDAVIEMCALCDPDNPISPQPSLLQKQANAHLRDTARRWIKEEDFLSAGDNKFRLYIKTYCSGSIGQRFLEKYYV